MPRVSYDEPDDPANPIDSSPAPDPDPAPVDPPPDDNSVDATLVAAPGIIRDKFSGKIWAVPTGTFEDAGIAIYKSPRDIQKDPEFHYEFCRSDDEMDELPEKMAQGFVPVTRRELGMEAFSNPGQPSPMDEFYVIDGHDVCIKIPRVIAKLRYDALKRVCDTAVAGVNRGLITKADGASRDNIDAGGDFVGPVERSINARKTNREPMLRDE